MSAVKNRNRLARVLAQLKRVTKERDRMSALLYERGKEIGRATQIKLARVENPERLYFDNTIELRCDVRAVVLRKTTDGRRVWHPDECGEFRLSKLVHTEAASPEMLRRVCDDILVEMCRGPLRQPVPQ
jgi:hypothetical protein